MKGRITERFVALLLVALTIMAFLPSVTLSSAAATSDAAVAGLSDENIGLSFTGNADNAWSATGTTITGSVVSAGGTCSDTSYNSTLTIKNNKKAKATLSFNYAIEQNSGTIKVDETAVTANGSFNKELTVGESIKVYIGSGSTTATKITMTNVALVSDVTATTTFAPAENGTYTVDGKAVTEEYSNKQSSMTAYQVVATPAEGYQFLGWYNLTTGKCIATAASTALNIESDCTITAKFAIKTVALFETGGQRFADLNEAVAYAQANKQSKITLATDGSISGTYTIPSGITLLIPFDAAGTLYTDSPAAIRTTPASKAFRTLTMSEGTSITVNGAISLGGRYFAAGGGQQGRPVGDYGYIKMADNSSITVKKGGNLYAWGFISGSGSVLAESGATVYEFYQIADFRGGSASSNMGNKVFPFSQYFVQNIEVPLTLNAGANEKVFSGVYAMSTTYTTSIKFIGNDGMFKVASGSFTKDYDEKTDRLVFTVNGEAALNTLSLKLAGMSVNSASYVLPITNNITINIQSGNVTINQDTALLAGVEVSIAEGAGLTVANGKNVYVYDGDEWNSDNFVWGPCKFKSVAYAPGKAYNRTNTDLKDAKVDVNGSLTAIGAIYTTKGGADICSSNGTGKYVQQGTPGTETATYQYNANGNNAVTIPITAAKLYNADGSYTETKTAKAGDTINYVSGVWGGTAKPCDHKNTEIRNAKDATCTEPGYTGDTYCKDCGEIIASGKVIPAKGHTEVVRDQKPATLTEDGYTGNTYCSICNAKLKTGEIIYHEGWRKNGDNYYYYKDQEPVTGIVRVPYPSEELLPGYGPDAEDAEVNVPGKEGNPDNYDYPDHESALFVFDENGVFQKEKSGMYDDNGVTRWIENGMVVWHAGLVKDGDDFRYFKRNGMVANIETYVAKTNGLLKAAKYTFDADGRLMKLEGLNEDLNGNLCYYVDYVKNYAGLVEKDGSFYYIASDLKAVKNAKHFVFADKSNGLKPAGWYWFNSDGTMFLDGILKENGTKYYYKDGKKNYAGLIEIEGSYYYVKSDCSLVCGRSYYVTKTNDLVPNGTYTFDEDGKMEIKNGIYREKLGDGKEYLFYYVDNVRQINTGLVQLDDGSYIYVRSGANLAIGDYYVTKTNGLLPNGVYTFGDDGKMIINP